MFRSVPRVWLILDIVGAALGLLVTLPLSLIAGVQPVSLWIGADAVAIALFLLVAIALWGAAAIARLSPAIALIIAWAGAVVQMAAGLSPLPFDVAIFVVLFATAAWGTTRMLWVGGASAVAGGLVAGFYVALSVIRATPPEMPAAEGVGWRAVGIGASLGLTFLLALVMAWGAGLLWRVVVREREGSRARMLAEASAAEEQQRVAIARDMHDVVAHSLAVVIAQADGARYAAAADPDAAAEALGTISQTARSALSDVRLLLTQLRHRQGEGPQPTLADLESLFAQVRDAGVEPQVTVDPMPPGEPPAAVQLAVYRILQEALTNALRHGTGDPVGIRLAWYADAVDLVVDNAVGAEAVSGRGHGLIGMRERAQLVGGALQAEREGDRFVVRARLPIGAPSPAEGGVA